MAANFGQGPVIPEVSSLPTASSHTGRLLRFSGELYASDGSRWVKTTLRKVQSVTSSATVTPNADTDDAVHVTAQAAAMDLANPTGTAVDGQKLVVRIKDNGTARALTYGTQYRAMGNALPATTVINKTMYLGFIYCSADTKWDLVAVAQEA